MQVWLLSCWLSAWRLEYRCFTSWVCMSIPSRTLSFTFYDRARLQLPSPTAATLAILLGLTSLGVLTGSFPRTAPLIDGVLSFVLVVVSRLIISFFSPKEKVSAQSPLEDAQSQLARPGSAKARSTTASWAARWGCTCCGASSPLAHLPRSAGRSNAGGVLSPAGCMAARRAPR